MLEESVLRRSDLRKCYDKIVKRYRRYGTIPSTTTLINETVVSRAPGYYLTYDYARRLLSDFRHRRLRRKYNPLRRDMIREIARKIDRMKQRHPDMSEGEALTMVLTSGCASRFFISPASARRIINHKKHYKR